MIYTQKMLFKTRDFGGTPPRISDRSDSSPPPGGGAHVEGEERDRERHVLSHFSSFGWPPGYIMGIKYFIYMSKVGEKKYRNHEQVINLSEFMQAFHKSLVMLS